MRRKYSYFKSRASRPSSTASIPAKSMMKYHEVHFSSIEEIIEVTKASHARRGGRDMTREEFIGRAFGGFADACEAARSLWPEGLDIVQEMIHELDRRGHDLPAPTDRRRRRRFSEDSGDTVDIDRLRAGQPYWEETRRLDVRAPQRVTILAAVATSASRDWQDILWRGAAAIVLADALEKRGYRVDIFAVNFGGDGYSPAYEDGSGIFCSLKVKDSGSPLDIPAITNAFAGWFYRTIFFQSFYCVNQSVEPHSGLGRPQTLTPEDERVERLVGAGSKTIVIDRVWNMEMAFNAIEKAINEINTEEHS